MNYSFSYILGDATVTKATLIVTSSSTSTIYGTAPSVTASYAGFQNSQGTGSLGTVPTCSSAVTAATGAGTYAGANTFSGGGAAGVPVQLRGRRRPRRFGHPDRHRRVHFHDLRHRP